MKLFDASGWSWLSCLLLFFHVPAGERQVKESAVTFRISNAGFAVNGTLAGLEATVRFDPAHLSQATIRASVPVSSIRTGIGLRDQHLQKPDYFDAQKFPLITLQSVSFRATGPAQYEGLFTLTMKGISRPVKLPFTVSATNKFRGELRVNRLDFGVGKKSLVLADEVSIRLVLTKSG